MLVGSSCLWLSSCGEQRLTGTSSSSAPFATGGASRLRLEPEMFLGSVPCAPGVTGALHYYVADIDDVDAETDAGVSTQRVTTPVVPCARSLRLDVRARRRYAATIRGYDERLDADPSVAPTWMAWCGRGSLGLNGDAGADPLAPTVAVAGITTYLRGCTMFRRTDADTGAVVVDTSKALGSWGCGSSAGQLAAVRAKLGSASVEVPCGCAALLSDVPPGHQEVRLEALGGVGEDAGAPVAGLGPCLSVEDALAVSGTPPGDSSASDAGVEPGLVVMDAGGGAPSNEGPAEPGPDAGVVDAGVVDAAAPPADASIDASVPEEAIDAGGGGSVPQLSLPVLATTTCLARVIAGAATQAACQSFPPAP